MKSTQSYQSFMKSQFRCIKHSTYFKVYDELFSRYKNKKITFVEIGVLSGGSLFMWRDFFGPQARIIGVDLNPGANKWAEYGFEIYIGDQSSTEFWMEFIDDVGPVDIVLDDGGHTYKQQIVTTEMLLSQVKDGGMLVVEDTHTSYEDTFGPKRYSFINYTKNFIDKINQNYKFFNPRSGDKRIWSVQFFESIVIFHINREASNVISDRSENQGIDDSAKDFRYDKSKLFSFYHEISKRFRFMNIIPGVKLLRRLTFYFVNNSFTDRKSLKKYF